VPGALLDAGLLAVGDLLGHEEAEVVAIGPALALRTIGERGVDAPGVGEMEPLEQGVDVEFRGIHDGHSFEGLRGAVGAGGRLSWIVGGRRGAGSVWPASPAPSLGPRRAALAAPKLCVM